MLFQFDFLCQTNKQINTLPKGPKAPFSLGVRYIEVCTESELHGYMLTIIAVTMTKDTTDVFNIKHFNIKAIQLVEKQFNMKHYNIKAIQWVEKQFNMKHFNIKAIQLVEKQFNITHYNIKAIQLVEKQFKEKFGIITGQTQLSLKGDE